jgi:hypothetical protein
MRCAEHVALEENQSPRVCLKILKNQLHDLHIVIKSFPDCIFLMMTEFTVYSMPFPSRPLIDAVPTLYNWIYRCLKIISLNLQTFKLMVMRRSSRS